MKQTNVAQIQIKAQFQGMSRTIFEDIMIELYKK